MEKYELDYSENIVVNDDVQNIRVRARRKGLPVILFLHGGPGVCDRHWVLEKQSALAEEYTIVCWDQRGSGKSYRPEIRDYIPTVEQFVDDVEFMLEYLTGKFGVEKVILAGHSWGTLIGTLAAYRYPDKVAAYIGQGQLVNGTKNEAESYAFCVREAQRLNDKRGMKMLEGNAPVNGVYPTRKAMMAQRDCLCKYGGESYKERKGLVGSLLIPLLKSKEYNLGEIIGYAKGALYLSDVMWKDVIGVKFDEDIKQLKVPVIITQGRHDYNTPSSVAREWFDALDAPFKKWIWFEESAHSPIKEESEKWGREVLAALKEAIG